MENAYSAMTINGKILRNLEIAAPAKRNNNHGFALQCPHREAG